MRSAVDAGDAAEEVVVGVAVVVEDCDGFVEVEDEDEDEAVSDGAVQPRISPAESGALRGRIGS